jgi:2-dehydro-3-deoxy-D-arabinonate dehydratase
MKVYNTKSGIIVEHGESCYLSRQTSWDAFINRENLYALLEQEIATGEPAGDISWLESQQIIAPIGSQEVWAAGVTYLRSKTARMEESMESGGATFYDKVYDAERPEIFFKATAQRVVGTNDRVRIRRDSSWDVPEPELTLMVTTAGTIIGYTIGNDMSSRSIEGENPLYLPQAKTYDRSAALGPCVLITETPIPSDTIISMWIERSGSVVFQGSISIDQMKRSHTELVGFLFRECSFPSGCLLMTGTCVVPGNDFTLQSQDIVKISIEHIGMLVNEVE